MRSRPAVPAAAGKPPAGHSRVRIGDMVVVAAKPSDAALQASVASSSEMLRRAKTALTRPGIRIPPRKDVPLFHVDEADPSRIVRRLNGQTEYGVFEGGVFRPKD